MGDGRQDHNSGISRATPCFSLHGLAKQVEEEYAARPAAKAATPKPTPAPEAVVPAPTPAPAPRAVARYVSWCRHCGEEVAVHTAAPRVTYCKTHEPRQTRKRDEAEDV